MQPKTLRLFFAIVMGDSWRQTILDTVKRLKQQPGANRIHWWPTEKWHITTRFLGSVPIQEVDTCITKVQTALQPIHPFTLTLSQLSAFPLSHPRLLVIKIPLTLALAQLYQVIDSAAVSAGVKPESRPYLPHITLGKFDGKLPVVLEKIIIPKQTQLVREIVLFSSDTLPEGSVYTPMKRFEFTG